MKSAIFYSDAYHQIENRVKNFINEHPAFLSSRSMDSPRAVGDAIESIVRDEFDQILGDLSQEYSAQFARRAMADIAFTDHDGLYYIVDVKTHRTDTRFNMPNLTSVQRLARFYEDDSNYFVILLIEYHIDTRPIVTNVIFVPIEFLGWDCLTIGALGWGQIQSPTPSTSQSTLAILESNGCWNFVTLCWRFIRARSPKSMSALATSKKFALFGNRKNFDLRDDLAFLP